jgi:hypothetical protein
VTIAVFFSVDVCVISRHSPEVPGDYEGLSDAETRPEYDCSS